MIAGSQDSDSRVIERICWKSLGDVRQAARGERDKMLTNQ
jgi:hypothetical protein